MPGKNPFDGLIAHSQIIDGLLKGQLLLPSFDRPIAIELELEEEYPTLNDFTSLIPLVNDFIHQSANLLPQLRKDISLEITESAYEQEDELASDEAFKAKQALALEQDLQLDGLLVFSEGYVLYYQSTKLFPGNIISAQLTTGFEIDDLAVNE